MEKGSRVHVKRDREWRGTDSFGTVERITFSDYRQQSKTIHVLLDHMGVALPFSESSVQEVGPLEELAAQMKKNPLVRPGPEVAVYMRRWRRHKQLSTGEDIGGPEGLIFILDKRYVNTSPAHSLLGFAAPYEEAGDWQTPTAAVRGYGPLLYDIAAILSGNALRPSVDLSKNSKRFWERYTERRIEPLKQKAFFEKYGVNLQTLLDRCPTLDSDAVAKIEAEAERAINSEVRLREHTFTEAAPLIPSILAKTGFSVREAVPGLRPKKNPKGPPIPESLQVLQPGVRVRVTAQGIEGGSSIGTVTEVPRNAGRSLWTVRVRLDGRCRGVRLGTAVTFGTSLVACVTPIEELAALGKKNPRQRPQEGSRVRVQRSAGWGGETAYGTIVAVTPTYVGKAYMGPYKVQVLIDAHPEPFWFNAERVEEVTPLEELAAQAKKNPFQGTSHFMKRVDQRTANISNRKARNLQELYDAFQKGDARTASLHGRYAVQFGGEPRGVGDYLVVNITAGRVDGFISVLIGQRVILRDTSIIPASAVLPGRSNPGTSRPGDRFFWKRRGQQQRRVCTLQADAEQPRNPAWKMVKMEDTGTWLCVDTAELERIGPLEELALLAKAKKNPNYPKEWLSRDFSRYGWGTFMPGDKVRVKSTREQMRVVFPSDAPASAGVRLESMEGDRFSADKDSIVLDDPLEELAAIARGK